MDRKPSLFIELRPRVPMERITNHTGRKQAVPAPFGASLTESSSNSGLQDIGLAHSSGCDEVLSSVLEVFWRTFAVVWQVPLPPPRVPVFEDREVQQCVGPLPSKSYEEFRPMSFCNHSLRLLDKTTINLTKTTGYIMHCLRELSIMGKLRSFWRGGSPAQQSRSLPLRARLRQRKLALSPANRIAAEAATRS
jgi:hypothetical protein